MIIMAKSLCLWIDEVKFILTEEEEEDWTL